MSEQCKELLKAISVAQKFEEEAHEIILDFKRDNLGYPNTQKLKVPCYNCGCEFEAFADIIIGKARLTERIQDSCDSYTLAYTSIYAVCPKCRKEANIY